MIMKFNDDRENEINISNYSMEKTPNQTGERLPELKAIIEKRRAIKDGEERQEGSSAGRQKPKSCNSS